MGSRVVFLRLLAWIGDFLIAIGAGLIIILVIAACATGIERFVTWLTQ